MRTIQNLANAVASGNIHWALLTLGAGALLLLILVVGRAILTILTLD